MPSRRITILALLLIGCVLTATLFVVTAADERIAILPVGDSITVGYMDNPYWNEPFSFGYRSRLFKMLTDHGCRVKFVGNSAEPWRSNYGTPKSVTGLDLRSLNQDHHRGYDGWRLERLSRWLPLWLLLDRPNVILLMAGINDMRRGAADNPVTAEAAMTEVIGTIRTWRPSAKLFVGTVTPYTVSTPAIAHFNRYIVDELQPSFARDGYHFIVVDQFSPFVDPEGTVREELFSNGLNHPSAVGYDKIAEAWFAAIKPAVCGGANAAAHD